MAVHIYDLEFTATFRRRVEAESEAEAQSILDVATIGDVYQNHDWDIDPFEFEKSLVDLGDVDEDEDEQEGGAA